MSNNLRGHLLAAVFSAGFVAAAAAPACSETLSDAVALAYETNPTLQAQRATQRALDENYVQARSGWRPTLNLQLVATYDQTRVPRAASSFFVPAGIRESNTGSVALTFNQPIWTGGRTSAAVTAAQGDVLQGRENLRRLEGQVMQAVIQAYEDVRRDQEALAIRQEDLGVLQKQLEESRARFDVGEITRTDVAQSEARLAAAQALLQSSQAQLAISRSNYAALVGQNPGQLAPEPSLAYLLPGNVDDAFAVAEKYSPQLRAQLFAEQASRARVAGARAERMPRLDLQASGRFLNGPVDPFTQSLFTRDVTVSGVVTVPLFNGGLTSSRIRQSIERNNADKITIETQRRAVLQAITQGWNQLVAARANIGSNTEQVRAAEISLEGTRQEQQVGLRTTLDILNADVELRNAQLSLVVARHDEYVGAASVLVAMGRLEARDLIPTVPQYSAGANFRRLRITLGWVPWEEAIAIVDRAIAVPPIPLSHDLPVEKAIPPGLQPPPAPAYVSPPRR
ncbi:TolC family outer membrane protein [Phenylobacterium sp.]|uniref:TolC family outer membrane protein n=1 Tax=Phenylobacterium sp. TaxID=1871053 RepID=UPI002DE33AFB|nr:TolC family outer membrane protein [Phenylobacterium sp.]